MSTQNKYIAVPGLPGFLSSQTALMGAGFGAWLLMVGWAYIFLGHDTPLAKVLFDYRERATIPFPFSMSCAEWLVFCLGSAELVRHWLRARHEMLQLSLGLLPEDEDVMLDRYALAEVSERINRTPEKRGSRLHRLIKRTIWQFHSSESISQAASVMDATLELDQHDLDLEYSMIRYAVWVIPTIGFIGTVWGLSQGLGGVKGFDPSKTAEFQSKLAHVTDDLSLAFNTTFVALVLSCILVLAMQMIQRYEEESLNKSGQYCIDNLINKLLVRQT